MAAPHFYPFTTDVASAGTRAQISDSSRKVLKVWVKPHEGNSGVTYFGDVTVSATVGGWSMSTTEEGQMFDFSLAPPTLDSFYVDAATNGDDVDTIFLLE
jgi:hypothetical protein